MACFLAVFLCIYHLPTCVLHVSPLWSCLIWSSKIYWRKAKNIYSNSHNPDYNNHLLLLHQRCSLLWTLAPSSFFLISQRYLAIACLFFIPIIFKSSSTSSFHLLRGLPPLICSFYSRYCDLFWYSLVLRSLNVTNSLSRRDFTNFTVQCFIWMNSNHMCGAGGATATVSCCLATVQERLQRSSLWTDVRTLTKFQIWYYRNTSDASLTFRNLASYI